MSACDFEVDQADDGTYGWTCGECCWAGLGCPSVDFAAREHEAIAADIRDGVIPAGAVAPELAVLRPAPSDVPEQS
jgi:hypothetical protein